ncbi:MAG: hypothetical protein WBW92_10675 [Rhodanobacteraceae bacterium]
MCHSTVLRRFFGGVLWVTLMVACGSLAAGERGSPPPPNPQLDRATVASPWTAHREFGQIIYFLYDGPPRVERYDVQSSTWLSAIPLSGAGSAFDVDSSGIYVSEVGGVEHFDLSGAAQSKLTAVPDSEAYLFLIGDYFVTAKNATLELRLKSTGTTVGNTASFFTSVNGYSGSIADRRIYVRDSGVSPSDIHTVSINTTAATMGSGMDSPYHGAFPSATQTYARPAGGMVIDNSGTVYAGGSLERLGNLGGPVQAMAYLSDRLIALRGGELAQFSYDLHETGQADPPANMIDLAVIEDNPYVLGETGGVPFVQPLDLESLSINAPPPARAWIDSERWADHVIGDGSRLLLVSANEHAVYPFNWSDWSYGAPIPLYVAPEHVAYSAANDTFYASYAGGAIWGFPGQGQLPSWLSSTPFTATGLATAGQYIFASDPSGAWSSHSTFTPGGTLISWEEWNYTSRQYEWDPVLRKMYFFRDGTSPNDLHWEKIGADGSIVDAGESPYHGEVSAQIPIRVSPDGSQIVIGSGQIFEAGGLTFSGDLQRSVSDVAWSGGNLYAIAETPAPALFIRFSPTYAVTSAGRVRGTPRRLVPAGNNFLYVADVGDTTIIGVLDPFLSKADLAVDPYSPGGLFANGSTVIMDVNLGNNGSIPASGAHVTGDLSMLVNASWQCIDDTGVTGCDGSVHTDPLDLSLDIQDGGQAHLHITGTVPYGVMNAVSLPIQIEPAIMASDPELRNNGISIDLRLNELFSDDFE